MSLETFQINTLIIPMDAAFQNNGMFKAYGLVYNLLSNGIPVKWSIKPGKPFDGTDFVATTKDFQTGTPIVNHTYTGGPFIIDSAFEAAAAPFITSWQGLNPNVKVHVATAPFQADIASTMARPARIAVEAVNSSIMTNYLNLAGIPDSNGNAWPNSSPDILTETEIGQGALFGYNMAQCRRISYDIFLSPHTGDNSWDAPGLVIELNDYLIQGGFLHATCHSVRSIENSPAGPFLTQSGIPLTDTNKGDAGTFVVDIPDFPSAQAVSTGLVQGLPGGSFQTVYHLSPGLVYNAQTQILAHFTQSGKQYDFMMAGPYKNGAGAGKIVYEGGHDYSPKLPYTSNMENLYYRFVLDSIFFSISKPLMFLEFSPTTLVQNAPNTITFSVVNTGGSPAVNTSFSVTLATGVTYNGDASIPPTSIVGQTITWSSAALGNVPSGTVLTFTADYSPTVLGTTKLADFSSSFGDNFKEEYSLNHCVTANVAATTADISVTKIADKNPVIAGNLLTYTVVVSNAGPDPSQNVTLTDVVPLALTGVQYSTDGGATWNLWGGSLSLGTLADGSSVTILIRGTVSPSAMGTITNTVTVSSITPDPNMSNNTATVTTIVNGSADISVEKTDSPDPVIAGNVLTYTMVVSNSGPSDAQNVTLTDVVPLALTGVQFSTDGGATWNPWVSPYSIGTLLAGATVTILIRGTVNPSATGIISNTAVVNSTTPDPDPTNNTSTVITEVNESADISVKKTDSPDPVIAGNLLTYTMVVSNAGPSDAQNVTLTDAVPATLTGVQFSTDGGTTWNSWVSPYSIGTLLAGATVTILIRGTVNPSASGTITNTATVSSTTPDPNPTNNTSTVTTQVNESADISVKKTASPDPVIAGNVLTYTMVVSNAGPSDAQNVILTDTVPATLTGVQFSTDGGTTWNPWTGSYSIGTLLAGAIVTILIRGTVNPSAAGTITNTATVNSTTLDPDPTNNTSTVITQVNESADISVKKTASPDPVIAGNVLTYTMVVSNAGPSDAQNVTLTDVVPLALTGVQFSTDGGTTWNPWVSPYSIGTLAVGASDTILIRGTVSASAAGSIVNTATVNSTTPDPNPDNNTSTVTTQVNGSADVSVVKTASPNPVIAGNVLTYTVVVSNSGPSSAQNVTLTDTVPLALTGVQFSTDGGTTWSPWVSPYSIGTLVVGASKTILIRGTVSSSAAGNIVNTATVSSTTPDPNPANNTSTVTTQVNGSADVSVVKTASPNPVIAGNVLTYTMVVSNAGPSDAQNVALTDAVPLALTGVQFATDGGATWNPWVSPYTIGNLLAGATVTILIRGTVSASASGNIVNTATVSSTTPDPNPANNTSTVTTQVNGSADVSVVKTASPNPVIAGNVLTYTMVVSNAGPSDAQNVTLTDAVPAALTGVQFSTDGGATWNPWVSPYTIGTLAAGATVTILIRGTVSASASGNIVNTATVSSTTPDPNPGNNTSTVTTQVNGSADVSVVKTASPNPVIAGNVLTYTVVVSNAGPSSAQNVTLTDAVPLELTGVQFSTDGGAIWNPWVSPYSIGTLAVGESETILIRGTVSSSATGNIVNTATVSSTTPDPNRDNNTSTVTTQVNGSADISVVKTASPNPVIAGNVLTYTVVVSNAGPSSAQNVTLTDTVPGALTGVQFSTDGGTTWNPWVSPYSIGTLAVGASKTILIRGTVSASAAGNIVNTATVSSTTPDPNPNNNTSTVTTQVNGSADVSVVKTASPNPVIAGNVLTYTVVVSNAGPSNAQNVTLTDTVPAALTGVQFSTDGGVTWNIWVSPYTIGTLAAGAIVTILIKGTVSASAIGNIVNTATVSSTTPDPNPNNNTSTVTTTINGLADISVVKTDSPDPVIAGNVLTYTMVVSNVGPSDAQNVMLTDSVPLALTGVQFSTDGGATWNPWVSPYTIGTLVTGATVTILIRGTVSASAAGTITNTATVNSTTPDPDPTNNTSTVRTQVETSADISVVKTDSPDPVIAGNVLTYTMVVSNAGPSDAQNVMLTDAVPAALTGVQFSTDGGAIWNPWVSPYSIGTLAVGVSKTILIRGTVSASASGNISNTATVSSTTPDPNPDNNISTVTTQVNASADISVVKTASPNPVIAGNVLTYTVVVSNSGPSSAKNVTLTDTVPAALTGVQFSTDGGTTWNPWVSPYSIGTLAVGATVTILIRGTVSSSATGTISNTATVSSTTPDPNPVNNTSTVKTPVNASADISVVKTASPNPVIAGNVLTYTVVVANAGPSDAQNVTLTDTVPAALTGVQFSTDGGIIWNPWVSPYSIGILASGASVTILIRGTVSPSASGTISNTATASSTTSDPNPDNNTSTVTTTVNGSSDVSVVKTASPNPVIAGNVLTYTVVVANAGPSDAQNVTLTDTVPLALTGVQFSTDGGTTWNPWVSPYSIGTLANGASLTILIKGTVSASATGTISNTATVNSTTPDPNPNNNTSTVTTSVNASADVSVVKIASSNNVTVGDIVTYTVVVSNEGPSNAQNVTLTDAVPATLTGVQFSIDGGTAWNPWVSPYSIGTLASGESETILIRGTVSATATGTISNTATVNSTTPDPNPNNNTSTIDIKVKLAKLEVVKSVDKTAAKVGDTLTYTVSIKNTGNTDAENVIFKDAIPVGTSFVGGSVSINEIPDLGANPQAGINIGTIAPGKTTLVSFTVKVESRPTPPEVVNTAVVDYEFTVDSSRPPIKQSTTSNTVKTEIEIVKVDVVKSADKTFVVKGDIITYTVIITNSSTIPVNNVMFKDPIPAGTILESGSLTINDKPASGDPNTGINLGTLMPNQSVKVSFKVKFVSVPCPAQITNKAFVDYEYNLGGKVVEESVESNFVIIEVGQTNFKQFSVDETLRIPCQKPNAEDIINTIVETVITSTNVIKTIKGTSLEGQILTGYKLIVQGVLKQKIEYVADEPTQSVHAAEFDVRFSTFIVLPEDFVMGTNVEVAAYVEDVYFKLLDKRNIFKNITLRVEARF